MSGNAQVVRAVTVAVVVASCTPPRTPERPATEPLIAFQRTQSALFASPGAQPNAWADFDGDGDLDLMVGFRGAPNRLYRNDGGRFVDVAADVGLAGNSETRALAWGDFDADGDPDVYVGYAAAPGVRNRLYRNDGGRFTDVAPQLGLDLDGTTRQPAWVDYDGDGDLDFFIAFRDQANRLFRNDRGRFTDVTASSGIGDPRKTVGVVWFDMEGDGDLDQFVANQDGDADAFYRNDGGRFTDVAPMTGMDNAGRRPDLGSVGPAVGDFDNDGDLDLYVAAYGPDILWENLGHGRFRNIAPGTVLAGETHDVTAVWGDLDNDGMLELYVAGFLSAQAEAPDHAFKRQAGTWTDVTPQLIREHGASHGVAAADFDRDGALDLALANNHALGSHFLMRNTMPAARASRAIEVALLDASGHWTLPGAELRVFDSRNGRLLATRLVDSGSGYCSQGMAPLHVGLPADVPMVDLETAWFASGQRRTMRQRRVDVAAQHGQVVTIRVPRPMSG